MSTTNVNIRMDSELKKQFAAFCKDVGMNMSTAFNIFANNIENKVPPAIIVAVPTSVINSTFSA